jgi:beta-lactamase regulating signal transducer with metallopeptidase domain
MTISRLVIAGAVFAFGVCGILLDSHLDRPTQLVLGGVALLYVAQVARGLIEHFRLVRSLRNLTSEGELGGVPVKYVNGVAPFVAGILRPHVYCDPALAGRLTRQQQRAVALHERHHLVRRDPLRLQMSRALRPLGQLVPRLGARLDLHEARCEVAADRYALANGATRGDIAGALLAMIEDDRLSRVPGFLSVAEVRLRALQGDLPEFVAKRGEVALVVIVTLCPLIACLTFL